MAVAHMQLEGAHEDSTLVFDDGLASLLQERSRCSFSTAEAASYRPGELLQQSIKAASSFGKPRSDSASDVSTTDTLELELVVSSRCDLDDSEVEPPIEATPADPTCITELPSVGSARHGLGLCSPCGFVHKTGCGQGANCKYCHMCPPGTIELNRKMKRKLVKASKCLHQRPC